MAINIVDLVKMYPSLAEGYTAESVDPPALGLKMRMLDTLRTRWAEKPMTKRSIIAQAIYSQGRYQARSWALTHLQDSPYLTFSRNTPSGREPLNRVDAEHRLDLLISDMAKVVDSVKRAEAANGAPEAPKPAPVAPADIDALLAWLDKFHNFCEHRNADGKPVEEVGIRPYENGAKMLAAGLPLTAIKHALTMHLAPETRRGIEGHTVRPVPVSQDFDVASFGKREEGKHPAFAYIRTLRQAGVPIALFGPKGTGKSTLARQLAEDTFGENAVAEGKFGMVSMTAGTSPSAFYGRPRIAGDGSDAAMIGLTLKYQDADENERREIVAQIDAILARLGRDMSIVESLFVKCYRDGGVFLFDEMDAANENLLLIVNSALANGHFANPQTGELVARHPDFIPVAAMNTLGTGADRNYVGRAKQDAAALDRWAAGRTYIAFDRDLAHKIARQSYSETQASL